MDEKENLHNNESVEIVPSERVGILPSETIEEAEARIAKVSEALKRFRVVALKTTSPLDWVDFDGKPYLTASGVSKLISLFDIRTRNVRTDQKVLQDGTLLVEVRGKVSARKLSDGWIDAIGVAQGDDPFLTRGGKVKAAIGDVLKKAQTNFYVRAVTTVLGLSGLSWDDLEAAGVVSRSQTSRVPLHRADEMMGPTVEVEIPFKEKDAFKEAVRKHFGVTPKFNTTTKKWKIPEAAASHPEIAKIVSPPKNEEAPAYDGMFPFPPDER